MGSTCFNFAFICLVHICYCLSCFRPGRYYYNHKFYFRSTIPLDPLSDYPLTFGINNLSLFFILLLLFLLTYSVLSSIVFTQYAPLYERFRPGMTAEHPTRACGPQFIKKRPKEIRQHFYDLIIYLSITFFLLFIFCSIDFVAVIMVYKSYVVAPMVLFVPIAFLVDKHYFENKYRMFFLLYFSYFCMRIDITEIVFW